MGSHDSARCRGSNRVWLSSVDAYQPALPCRFALHQPVHHDLLHLELVFGQAGGETIPVEQGREELGRADLAPDSAVLYWSADRRPGLLMILST